MMPGMIRPCVVTANAACRGRADSRRLHDGWRALVLCLLGGFAGAVHGASVVQLTLGGSADSIAYSQQLFERVLEMGGHSVKVQTLGDLPMTRLEVMLQRGDISLLILGQTAERERKFLPVRVGMTDNLVNQRILFIPKGSQKQYDQIHSLADLRRLQLVAGVGAAWGDLAIWQASGLPVVSIGGDWKRLYRMVASSARQIDYLPRGAHEIASEWRQHTGLDVERNLVFSYERDHILYVSPRHPHLHQLLLELLPRAEREGLIRQVARAHYRQVFEPPVSLHSRHVIRLEPACSAIAASLAASAWATCAPPTGGSG